MQGVVVSFVANLQHAISPTRCPLPTAHCPLPTAHYLLPPKLHILRVARLPLPWTNPALVLSRTVFFRRSLLVTPKEVLALIREKEVKAVDLRFMDFPGLWQHFTIPAEALEEAIFEEGLGFDGSSIRGWQAINETDMLVMPAARDRLPRSVLQGHHAGDDLQHPGPAHPGRLHPRSAQRRPQGGQLHEEHRHRRHRLLRPGARVLRLRRRPLRPEPSTPATTSSTASKGPGTRGREETAATSATSSATRKAISPCRPPTRCTTSAPR